MHLCVCDWRNTKGKIDSYSHFKKKISKVLTLVMTSDIRKGKPIHIHISKEQVILQRRSCQWFHLCDNTGETCSKKGQPFIFLFPKKTIIPKLLFIKVRCWSLYLSHNNAIMLVQRMHFMLVVALVQLFNGATHEDLQNLMDISVC